MSRIGSFRQADLSRALKATVAAGLEVARVELDPTGRIVITTKQDAEAVPATDFDKWRAGRARPA
jgi:hypothetical protein